MKPNHSIRVSLIVCIVLVCMSFGVYSFVRLNMLDERRDFDLCTLVPQDVEAVFATDKLTDFIEEIDHMDCSRDNHFLYASDLFSCVKRYLRVLMEEEPHGLSGEMNEMLISFHPSDLKNNQVLYCKLGLEDHEKLESYIRRYGPSDFPSRTFDYRGQSISIYSLSDGRFLSLWMKRDFMVLSFQKCLVEQVIDTWKSGKSLLRLDTFQPVMHTRRDARESVLFLRWRDAGKERYVTDCRDIWLEFDMKLAEEGIYCAGTVHGISATDTTHYAFAGRRPLEGFSGNELPRSTLLYRCGTLPAGTSDWNRLRCRLSSDSLLVAEGGHLDCLLVPYLSAHAAGKFVSCMFLSGDSLSDTPKRVLGIALKDADWAQRDMHTLLYDISQGHYPFYKSFSAVTGISGMRLYRLPSGSSLISGLAGIGEGVSYEYATFYHNRLLLSSDEAGLVMYIRALEGKDSLEYSPAFETMAEQLSPVYDVVLMADMEAMALCPSLSAGLLPAFFEAYPDFFRYFQFAVQLCRVDGAVCPNIVLLYRLKETVSGLS